MCIGMKLLMATRADKAVIEEYAKFTLPIHEMYAKKWNADFKNLHDLPTEHPWRIMILRDLLKSDYDRVLCMDADIIINKNCPNIFNMVPHDTIGLVYEDKGSRLKNRRKRIKRIKQLHGGNEHWTEGYFNGGFFIISSMHREIFTAINGVMWDENQMGGGEPHIGYQIITQGHKCIDLGFKFNHMSMFSEPWNGSPSRFDSYIIHYAGGGRFSDKGDRSRAQLIKDDIDEIYGK